MSWLSAFLRSSIGTKAVMAVTGIVMFGFLIGHLAGNLLVYAGRDAINEYAKFLHDRPILVWIARTVLLVSLVAHVSTAIRLRQLNRAARPVRYAYQATVQASLASRTMLQTGLVVLAYVVYHLLHFTVRVTDPTAAQLGEAGDVYGMMLAGFDSAVVAVAYVVANGLLAWHLSHGIASFFQTLGLRDERYDPLIERGGVVLAALIGAGFISIPLSIQLGLVS